MNLLVGIFSVKKLQYMNKKVQYLIKTFRSNTLFSSKSRHRFVRVYIPNKDLYLKREPNASRANGIRDRGLKPEELLEYVTRRLLEYVTLGTA